MVPGQGDKHQLGFPAVTLALFCTSKITCVKETSTFRCSLEILLHIISDEEALLVVTTSGETWYYNTLL